MGTRFAGAQIERLTAVYPHGARNGEDAVETKIFCKPVCGIWVGVGLAPKLHPAGLRTAGGQVKLSRAGLSQNPARRKAQNYRGKLSERLKCHPHPYFTISVVNTSLFSTVCSTLWFRADPVADEFGRSLRGCPNLAANGSLSTRRLTKNG